MKPFFELTEQRLPFLVAHLAVSSGYGDGQMEGQRCSFIFRSGFT
jgi:hypothetical protein